jgi:hypothetical protein
MAGKLQVSQGAVLTLITVCGAVGAQQNGFSE